MLPQEHKSIDDQIQFSLHLIARWCALTHFGTMHPEVMQEITGLNVQVKHMHPISCLLWPLTGDTSAFKHCADG